MARETGRSPTCFKAQQILSLILSFFGKTNQGDLARTLYRHGQHALVLQTIPGNAPRHNTSAFRQKVSQQTDILKIDRRFIDAKPAGLATLKKTTASPTAITTFCSFHACLRLLLFVFI
jgi:hypothetical protein